MLHQLRKLLHRAAFIDINAFPLEEFTNGANIQYREILRRLIGRGVEGAILTVAHHNLSPRSLPYKRDHVQRICSVLQGIPVVEYLVQPPPEEKPEPYREAITRALEDFSPDLIFINTPPARLLEVEVMLVEEIYKRGTPVFCVVPDDYFPRPEDCDAALYRRYKKCLAGFVGMCPSKFVADRVVADLFDSVELMPNLFTTEEIVSDYCRGEFITLINPHPMKGIRVFEAVAQRMPTVPFLVVQGWPYPPRYETSLDNIRVMPFKHDMRLVWRQTKLLSVPSLCNEAFGRVVVEAMLNGIPVIAHNKGGLPEASGSAAVLIEAPPVVGDPVFPELAPGDLERLVEAHLEAINSLLSDEAHFKRTSLTSVEAARSACEAAEERFNEIMAPFIIKSDPPTERTIAVLSPHADDAAISIGGLIRKVAKKYSCNILTLFGRSNYTRELGFHAGWEAVTSRREREDRAYAIAVGARLTYFDFPEASLRLGSSFEAIFTGENYTDSSLLEELSSVVAQRLNEIRPLFLLAPLGLGGHCDHVLIRELARVLASGRDFKTVFYEDLPYAAETPEEMILEHIQSVELDLAPTYVPLGCELNSKLDALMLYESQIGPEEVCAVRDYALGRNASTPTERIWSAAPLIDFLI